MHPQPVPKLRDLFEQALLLQPVERATFLRGIQFSYPLLYSELQALLFAHRAPTAFFEQDGGLWSQIAPTSYVGRRFGPYVIEAEIGRGGMGTVYQATRADESYTKTVAIKVIAGPAADATLEAFRRERQILASLEHPYIARLLDGGATEDGLLFLVMEFVDGRPLDRYVKEEALSIEATLRLFQKICEAVAYAHRNLIVHRDLKPGNILVDNAGVPRLLDFGIAKVLDPSSANTATQALRLTPDFASPEQIRGQAITTASDIYSLGVVLFHVLSGGVRPYRTTSPGVQELLNAVLERPSLPPSAVAPPAVARRLLGDVDNIVQKAMAKEVARRYSSIEQLEEDLRRHLSGRPVLARPDTFLYRSSKFLQRNRLGASAAALLALSIGLGVWSTVQQTAVARRESALAQQERQAAVAARQQAEWQRQQAEAQRQRAEEQRLQAEQQSRLAREQKALAEEQSARAEKSSAEARYQSQQAQTERAIATQRYQSVRSLATSVLVDVNDALRSVPGSGPSRIKAVLAALQHLESLAKTSNNDVELVTDLASAYERIGEILQGLPSEEASLEAPMGNGEIPPLLKALRFRQQVAAQRPGDGESLQRLAESKRLLANSYLTHKQLQNALSLLQEGIADLPAGASDLRTLRTQALLQSDLCQAYTTQGNPARAVQACEAASRLSTRARAPLAQRLKVFHRWIVALRNNYDPTGALQQCQAVLQLIREEGYPQLPPLEEMLLQLRKLKDRPLLGQMLRLHAMALWKEDKRDASLEAFEESFQLLNGKDPDSASPPRMQEVLNFAKASQLQLEAWAQFRQGQRQGAKDACRQAIVLLEGGPGIDSQTGTGAAARVLRVELEANLLRFESPLAAAPAAAQP
jgi:serine/threonine protein kinase